MAHMDELHFVAFLYFYVCKLALTELTFFILHYG